MSSVTPPRLSSSTFSFTFYHLVKSWVFCPPCDDSSPEIICLWCVARIKLHFLPMWTLNPFIEKARLCLCSYCHIDRNSCPPLCPSPVFFSLSMLAQVSPSPNHCTLSSFAIQLSNIPMLGCFVFSFTYIFHLHTYFRINLSHSTEKITHEDFDLIALHSYLLIL